MNKSMLIVVKDSLYRCCCKDIDVVRSTLVSSKKELWENSVF